MVDLCGGQSAQVHHLIRLLDGRAENGLDDPHREANVADDAKTCEFLVSQFCDVRILECLAV